MTLKNSANIEHIKPALIARLTSFGLSNAEATIYMYLLEHGTETGGSKIALGTGLHRQYVYLAIPKLLELGLVEEVPHGRQHRYVARSPVAIERIGRARALAAGDLARELNVLSNVGNEQEFEVIQGKRAIQQYEMQCVDRAVEGEEEFIIGGASAGFREVMGEQLDEYLEEKQRKQILVKYLGGISEIEEYKERIGTFANQEYRFLENLPEGTAHMVIRSTRVSFYTFLNPPLVYVVESTQVAAHYRKFFMMLWAMAPECKK